MSAVQEATGSTRPAGRRAASSGAHPVRLWFAISLALLAGWVDAIAFVRWGGIFVSFMSGNSTTLAVSVSMGAWPLAICVGAILLSFVVGVMIGEWIASAGGRHHYALVLLVESAFLFAATATEAIAGTFWLPALLLATALGIQNATVYQLGTITVAITYVTGTLVQIGRGLADAIAGVGPWRAPLPYLALWCGLVVGAALGALAAERDPTVAILAAACLALAFSAGTALALRRTNEPRR